MKEAIEFISSETAVKDFKHFLVDEYLSNKIFNIIPNILKKKEDPYEDEEIENFDELNLNDNELKEEMDGDKPLFTKKDFMDEDELMEDDFDKIKTMPMKKGQVNKYKLEEMNKQWEFPVKLGSYHNPTNLALEYIKFISEVVGIDEELNHNAFNLKKNALKLIKFEEFSPETNFEDPCRTFILHDVICEFCSNNKDIDFCRDKLILANKWTCDLCNAHYDKQFVEYLIINKVKNIIAYYFNQDLKCKKCKLQKNEYAFTRCECGGVFIKTFEENIFKNNQNIKYIEDYLDNITNIANYYSFENLKSMINQFRHY
jgi:hypothetical protein